MSKLNNKIPFTFKQTVFFEQMKITQKKNSHVPFINIIIKCFHLKHHYKIPSTQYVYVVNYYVNMFRIHFKIRKLFVVLHKLNYLFKVSFANRNY